ncbi:MAG: TRAP transporter large permease subunit [Treponema sp.]|jgi:tripartite ATP-independent transporter DctM subunit|nr:TRAP transporter large permease subunit [Treponema sp.]
MSKGNALQRKNVRCGALCGALGALEEVICYTAVICLGVFPMLGIGAGVYFTHVSNGPALINRFFEVFLSMSGTDVLTHLLLTTGLFAGMLTTKDQSHLAISIVQNFSSKPVKRRLAVFNNCLSIVVLVVIALSSLAFIRIWLDGTLIGFIPDTVFASVIPLGYTVMAVRFALQTPVKGWGRLFPIAAFLLGILAAFPVVAKFWWGFDAPDGVYALIDACYSIAVALKVPVIIILLVSAFIGAPLFVIIGGLSLILIETSGGELDLVANQIYATLTNDNFIAIPLFTLTGFLLSESKAGNRLVAIFKNLFSWLPGGMIIATMVICAFFATFTGATGVTILALGGILLAILKDVHYDEKFSIGLLTSAGSIGLLFPPSIPIILVGTTLQTNIIHVFLGGIFPGVILVVAMIIFGIIASIKTKIPVEKFNLKNSAVSIKNAIFEILLPFILIIGYFSGALSLLEISSVAVVYVFIVEAVVHRDITLKDCIKILRKALPIIGGILSILAIAQALSYYIVDTQAPENFARWLAQTIHSKYVFLLLLNLALLVVGCLMDIFSAILIVLPLVAPLGVAFGIDPVHLGIIFIINLEVGFLTPPVGMNLFLASYRFDKPFTSICRYVLPFLSVSFAVTLLVTYVPWFSTFLPSLFK